MFHFDPHLRAIPPLHTSDPHRPDERDERVVVSATHQLTPTTTRSTDASVRSDGQPSRSTGASVRSDGQPSRSTGTTVRPHGQLSEVGPHRPRTCSTSPHLLHVPALAPRRRTIGLQDLERDASSACAMCLRRARDPRVWPMREHGSTGPPPWPTTNTMEGSNGR